MGTGIATIRPPLMTVTNRHRDVLSRAKLDGEPLKIDDRQQLIPARDCEAVISEMKNALTGMGALQAMDLAKEILGAYPSNRPDNPDAYLKSIVIALQECPPDLYREVYKAITLQRESDFPPVANEVYAAVTFLTRRRRAALGVAEAHLRKHAEKASGYNKRRWSEWTDEERQAHNDRMAKYYADAGVPYNPLPVHPHEQMSAQRKEEVLQERSSKVGAQ